MKRLNRREFLCYGGCCSALLAVMPRQAEALWPFERQVAMEGDASDIRGRVFRGDAPDTAWKWSREALHYRRLEGGGVVCGICPHRCPLQPGDRSVCRSRVNIDGTLHTLVYGNPCAVHVDPVEKKPLFHFRPTARAFSVATAGCNLRCLNCQNWEISQAKPHEVRHEELFPAQVVAAARQAGAAAIAYTYSEPITFFEYMRDTAVLGRQAGLSNIWVSAGYINPEPLAELLPLLDAANVNLKAFSDATYRKLNGARLEPILETFRAMHRARLHFEMTHLVVPGYTDDAEMVRRMCDWILEQVGTDHPLHFSRFFPKYKLDRLPPTPVGVLVQFREIAMAAGIRYVYLGNVPGHEGNHTYCHACRRRIIARQGYQVNLEHLREGSCGYCGTPIPGVWG
jgi:pyruvate formate lyase activating enzyme